MSGRFLLMLSLALVLGGYFSSGLLWILVLFALLLIIGGRGRDPGRLRRIFTLIIVFAFGMVCMISAGRRYDSESELLYSKERISFSGRVSSHSSGATGTRIVLSSVSSGRYNLAGDLILYVDSDEYSIGTRLSGSGSVLQIRQKENDGGFDEASYLRCQNIVAKLVDVEITGKNDGFWFLGLLDHMSQRMRSFYEKYLPGEEGGILAAMCLGQKSALDQDARDLFSGVGLGHIFAISGLHISVVGMSVYGLMRKRRLSFALSGSISAIILIFYGIMVGPSPSSIRAIGMFLVYIIAQITGSAYDMSSSAALLLILEFMDNPLVIMHSGLIMSFLAVFFISAFLLPGMERVEMLLDLAADARRGGDPDIPKTITVSERIKRALFSSFMIQLALLPVVAMMYSRIPGYAVFLNMVLLPMVAPFLVLSLVSGLISLVIPGIASVMIVPCHYIIYFYEWCCDAFGRLPGGSVVCGYPGVLRCGVYYLLLLAVFFVWTSRQDSRIEALEEKAPWRRGRVPAVFASAKEGLGFWALAVVMVLVLFIKPPEAFSVTMLSVGQGDGICIESGRGGHIFIDGGSSSREELGKYVLEKYFDYHGIDHIDVWFLTHFDLDHVSGCMEMIEKGFRVKRLVLARDVELGETGDRILKLCEKQGVPISYMSAGQTLKIHGLSFTALSPPHPTKYAGPNENSLVLWMKYSGHNADRQFDALFTGDMGAEQEEDVAKSPLWKSLISDSDGSIELLKAAHHGSNYSNCSIWLSEASPELCIISAGENNRYGHPGKETVARLQELKIPCFCTVESGQIRIKWEEDSSYKPLKVIQFND